LVIYQESRDLLCRESGAGRKINWKYVSRLRFRLDDDDDDDDVETRFVCFYSMLTAFTKNQGICCAENLALVERSIGNTCRDSGSDSMMMMMMMMM
jgi:hypothetical protein